MILAYLFLFHTVKFHRANVVMSEITLRYFKGFAPLSQYINGFTKMKVKYNSFHP